MPKRPPGVYRTAVGRWVKESRERKDMTQEALALAMGSTQPKISRIERGKRGLRFETLTAFCEVFGVTITEAKTAIEALVEAADM